MRRSPTMQLPASPGPWVSALRCTKTSDGLVLDGNRFTGVLVTVIDGRPSPHFDRVRLDRYVDGFFASEFADDFAAIDTSLCLEFTDDHYAVKYPAEATANVQLGVESAGDCALTANRSSHASLRFDPTGKLASVYRGFGPDGDTRGHWHFYDDGRVKSASVSRDGAEPALLHVSFNPDGRLEALRIEGAAHTLLPAVSERQDCLWLPPSIREIFGFDVASTFKLPWAPQFEAEIRNAAPTWCSQVECLDLSGAVRLDFARELIETLQPTSLNLGALTPARNTFLHGGEPDDAQLMRLGCDFMAAGGAEVQLDHGVLGSTNSDANDLLGHRSVIVFDAGFEHLVGLGSPFLRPLHVHLMEASPKLEYAWFPRGNQSKKELALKPLRAQHPQAHFDDSYEQRDAGYEAFADWLRRACSG